MTDFKVTPDPICRDKVLAGLPDSVREIAEVIGRDLALCLIDECATSRSGASFYVPARFRRDCALLETLRNCIRAAAVLSPDDQRVAELAEQAAKRLIAAFPGEILNPSNGRRHACRDSFIYEELARGRPLSEVAALSGLTERQLRNVARDLGLPPRKRGRKAPVRMPE